VTPLTPEQAHVFVHTAMMGLLKNESRTTKSVLAAVPNSNLDYRPHPHSKTANELLRHIAAADNFFLKSVIDGEFVPGSVAIPESIQNPADVAEWYAETYAGNLAALGSLPAENLVKILDFRGRFQMPAYSFIQFGLVHAIHHRGQLTTYLRPMGTKVPVIYGESYDSLEAKKAAQAQA